MSKWRLSDNHALNNVALILIAAAIVMAGLLTFAAILSLLLRAAASATRSATLKHLAERARRAAKIGVTVAAALLVLAACSVLAFAIFRDLDLAPIAERWIEVLSREPGGRALRDAAVASAVVVASGVAMHRVLNRAEPRVVARLNAVSVLKGQEVVIEVLAGRLRLLVSSAWIYLVLGLSAAWIAPPAGLLWAVFTALFVVIVVQASRVSVLAVSLSTEVLDRVGVERIAGSRFDPYYTSVRGVLPFGRRVFEAMAYLAAGTLIVERFEALETLASYGPRFIRLLAIFLASRVVIELSRALIAEGLTKFGSNGVELKKRRLTLTYLLQGFCKYGIYFCAGVLMLQEIGVDPTPILAGAGIAGLAVSLGAQKLVNDVVSGFFILFDGHILTSDYVKIDDAEGIVESIGLRATVLRHEDGGVHSIRNGDIETIINYSRDYSLAIVDVGVPFRAELEAVLSALADAGERLRAAIPERVSGDPEVRGVVAFQEGLLMVRIVVRTVGGSPGEVERALRRLIYDVFRERDIEMGPPYGD